MAVREEQVNETQIRHYSDEALDIITGGAR